MLSSAELTAIRADVAQMLPDTCTLLTATDASDGQGGFTTTWGTATASVACRLDHVNGAKVLTGGAIQAYSGWMLTLPYDTTIGTTYRVVHGGHTYSVKGQDDDKSWPVSVRVMVERV